MSSPLTDHISVWETELINDQDKQFILKGISEGFDIIDTTEGIIDAECDNHASCFSSVESRKATEKQIINEIKENNYVITNKKPKIISALGSIPKQGSNDVRLIHDASRPFHSSLNSYASPEKCQYTSIDKVCTLLKPGYCFLCLISTHMADRG